MILFLFALALGGAFARCGEQEAPYQAEEQAALATYPYLVYLPRGYAADSKAYPVVFYLHGSSQRGSDLEQVKRSGLPRMAEEGLPLEFILIVPQCPAGKLWSTDEWFEGVWENVQSRYRTDPERLYLTGVSMGGGGTFDVAKKHPERFAALAPLCAWASTAQNLCRLKDVPVWTFHGTDDQVVAISETEEKVAALKACNGNIRYTRLQGEGHGIHAVYDPANDYNLLKWMLQHRLKR